MLAAYKFAFALLVILDSCLINGLLKAQSRLVKLGIALIPWIAIALFGVCTRANIINAEYAKLVFGSACVLFSALPVIFLVLELRMKRSGATKPNNLNRLILLLANALAIWVAIPVILVFVVYGGPRTD